jgi:5S rRNA maturation endonuclease (ribonuclease M5)
LNDDERLEGIEQALSDLEDLSVDRIVLIEGNKDRRALDELGLQNVRTIEVQREGGPLHAAEAVAVAKCGAVILTDWDDRGERIALSLAEQLTALCVPFDADVRNRLEFFCRKDIKDVESLPALYRRLSAEVSSALKSNT